MGFSFKQRQRQQTRCTIPERDDEMKVDEQAPRSQATPLADTTARSAIRATLAAQQTVEHHRTTPLVLKKNHTITKQTIKPKIMNQHQWRHR